MMERNMAPMSGMGKMEDGGSKSYGVTVEAQYTIGEYDIVILSANESRGLESWLKDKGYKIPGSAHKALEPYLKQKMKFFVAKVNIKEQSKTGFSYLRPIQFAFESPKFMLPIRLGMVNSDGPQDLLIYAITKKGRVETVEHYRTVKLPTGMDIPAYIKKKGKFADFYRDTFKTAHEKENKRAVMLEYAWNMGWCDPCAADPLTKEELRKIGVWWLEDSPASGIRPQIWPPPQQGVQAYITRLHVRYDAENFPEDLFFQETADIENFQGRYIIRHPWEGEAKCDAATQYKNALKERRQTEARVLASLTGWPLAEIQNQMGERISMEPSNSEKKWYETIFR